MAAGVRTRFAPSPTGYLHVGSVRTALFNHLFARSSGGRFVLRIEDTDALRSKKEFEAALMEDLLWLGLAWDEGPDTGGPKGPYRQSERLAIYREYAERLLKAGLAYRCYCPKERLEELRRAQAARGAPPGYDGRCRVLGEKDAPAGTSPAIRFRVPGKKVSFKDGAHGELSFDASTFADFVIMGSDNVASYNFAVVLDDALMEITHIIRGDDHISNTPRQILLLEALCFNIPSFTHIPLVLAPDRTPLGKRHMSMSISSLREAGYLPEAILNATARLGWSFGDGFATLREMSSGFSMERLSVSPSVFDEDKLKSLNRAAIGRYSAEELKALLHLAPEERDHPRILEIIEAVRHNALTLFEIRALLKTFTGDIRPSAQAQTILGERYAKDVIEAFAKGLEKADTLDEASYDRIVSDVKAKTGEKGKRLFMPLRCALTGGEVGVELVKVVTLLGRETVLKRIRALG